MPPRTRRQGSAAATGGPATAAGTAGLLDLPGALLEIVLSLLTHEERLRGPALVCRHLLEVARTPRLNTSARLRLNVQTASTARVLSFCRWLAARGAGSVQQLSVELRGVEAAAAAEVAPALAAALGACDGRALTDVQLCLPADLLGRLSCWVAALRGLRKLELACAGGSWAVNRSLARLSQLEVLKLKDNVSLASAALPPSLTRLRLGPDYNSWDLPEQVSSLTRLKALSVFEASYSDDSMALLARLPRLCSVDFYSCEWLPDCLSRLTGLERLCIDYQTIYARDADALPHLCQLTCLVLEGVTDHDAALAAALPRMPQLRALAWSVLGRHRPNFPGQPVLPPPGGPWLGRLLHLEADPWALEGLLPGATALRELGLDANLNIQTEPEEMMESVAEAARAAVALPALRQLSVYIGPCYGEPDAASPPPPSVLAALAGSRVHLQWIETELSNGSPLKRQFYE